MTRISHRQFTLDAALGLDPSVEAPSTREPRLPLPAVVVRVDVAETLSLDPRLLADLPAPTTLVCERVGSWVGSRYVVLTTSHPVFQAMTAPPPHPSQARVVPVFTGSELAAMTLAAEHDRGTPEALTEWCEAKLGAGSSWRLSAAQAIGPVAGRFDPVGWSLDRVLRALGLTLQSVDVGDAIPMPLTAAGGVTS